MDDLRAHPSPTLLALLLAGALGLAACETLEDDEPPPPWPGIEQASMGEMENVSYCGKLWVGGTPSRSDLELAVRRGVETVIDASSSDEVASYDLSGACYGYGLRYVSIGVEGEWPSDAQIDLLLWELRNNCVMRPALLFCGTGRRSAMVFAIFRVVEDGVPLDEALEDARQAGVKPGEAEDYVRGQVARILAQRGGALPASG